MISDFWALDGESKPRPSDDGHPLYLQTPNSVKYIIKTNYNIHYLQVEYEQNWNKLTKNS